MCDCARDRTFRESLSRHNPCEYISKADASAPPPKRETNTDDLAYNRLRCRERKFPPHRSVWQRKSHRWQRSCSATAKPPPISCARMIVHTPAREIGYKRGTAPPRVRGPWYCRREKVSDRQFASRCEACPCRRDALGYR